MGMSDEAIARAAEAIEAAELLVFTAGAGMGVDSGLPDFRGDEGFWRAYPPLKALGLSFAAMANPRWFRDDPTLAWGFYGHRLSLYRATRPHAGYAHLLAWGREKPLGYEVFTSNVDGAFVRAGFDPGRLVECHGAIDFLQCFAGCGQGIFSADGVSVAVDPASFRAVGPLPTCPRCGGLARPNIVMFGDPHFDDARLGDQLDPQRARFEAYEGARLVVIECGAGTAIPSVRHFGEETVARQGGLLLRINVREPQVPRGHVGLAMGARAALDAIDGALRARQGRG